MRIESKFLVLSLLMLWTEFENVSTCQPRNVLPDGEVCKTEESREGPDGGIIVTFSPPQYFSL